MNQEKGNWKPYNVRAIVSNVRNVFKSKDIDKLNKPTYEFIINYMGFIAHYDLHGFRCEYQDLRRFIKRLHEECHLYDADRQETDRDFKEWYGDAYNKSIAEATRGIVSVAREYAESIEENFNEREKQSDLISARLLLEKHGYKFPA